MQRKTPGSLSLIVIILILMVYSSCKEPVASVVDQEVYIPVKNNSLYIRLAGNEKGPIVLLLHGGPGGCSGFDREFYKDELEGQYLMGYLDQRGSGKSPAEAADSLITIKQFVQDLDVVIDTLHHRFPNRAIHLLGGSWGGTYGFLYLLAHQNKVRSFICVSGKVDGPYENKILIGHEKELVQQRLRAVEDTTSAAADTLRQIARELTRIENSDFDHFFEDVELLKFKIPQKLGFNPYWYDSAAHHRVMELAKDSSFFARAHYDMGSYDSVNEKGTHINKVFRNISAYNHIQLTDQLAKIKVPVAVIGGAEDYVVGPGQANLIYNGLTGLNQQQKELHILQGAAHNVNVEAADRYYPIIKAFLAKHP